MITRLKFNVVFFLALCFLAGCSKNQGIPPADRHAYKGIRDSADWRNPVVSVYADGIEVRGVAGHISPEKLTDVLKQLPTNAWPYGRVVGVGEVGIRSGNDDILIKNNMVKILKSLKEAGIEVELWPSA
ncbi:MAG TPA: hypothetical protein VIK62_07790 [Verrucomicrobiae bacterium]